MGQFKRRRFLAALTATTVASPIRSIAQQALRPPRIGFLSEGSTLEFLVQNRQRLMVESFGRAGYQVGRDIVIEWRFAEGKRERLRELADELISLKVDVLIASPSYAVHTAVRATQTIPIVMFGYDSNPVQEGLIASLARPGGNVTGTVWFADVVGIVVKQFEMLKQALPSAVTVASLWAPWGPANAEELVAEIRDRVYKSFGFVFVDFVVHNSDEIPSLLNRIAAMKPDALYVGFAAAIRPRYAEIAAFATRQKLVSLVAVPLAVTQGGLMYYGPDSVHVLNRTVHYVVRILRGAKPADLPVEQPDKYELLFNARTARAIGYTLSPALQLRVDRVIE